MSLFGSKQPSKEEIAQEESRKAQRVALHKSARENGETHASLLTKREYIALKLYISADHDGFDSWEDQAEYAIAGADRLLLSLQQNS